MNSSFDVTVVVPAYQAADWLWATLSTVEAQTLLPAALVVVDDGSTDETCRVVERFIAASAIPSVRLVRRGHAGPGAARNAAVHAAETPWIAFLDSDDLWHPDKLRRMHTAMLDNPAANFFCHNEATRFLDGTVSVTDYSAGVSVAEPLLPQVYRRNCFSTSAIVCRRELVESHGGFDETLSSAQDYELWLRMSPRLTAVFVAETLGTYVVREGNISNGRVWRRYLNAMRVRLRYRAQVGLVLFLLMVLRDTAAYGVAALRGVWRGRRSGRS